MHTRVRRPLRVALLHNIISPHVLPLFEQLSMQPGIELKVYFLAETERNRRWETSIGHSFAYEILPNWPIRIGRKDLFTLFVNPTIVPTLLRDGFDVLVSVGWDSPAAWAGFGVAKARHAPFILWSGSTANEPSWRRTLAQLLVRRLVRGAAAWIAYGSRAKQYLAALGADPAHVSIAYNTVDVDRFARDADNLRPQRQAIRAELGIDDGPVVLYVGQLIERKGVFDLLEAHRLALQARPTLRLLLAGYGPLEAELRRRVALGGLQGVHFLGHVALEALPRYYVAADCLVLPSHEEVWGLVLNEAAACGLPLVTTDRVGAGPDIVVPGENGFVVPSGDPAALADALQRAVQARAAMGAASRRIVGRLTYRQNVQAIVEAITYAASSP